MCTARALRAHCTRTACALQAALHVHCKRHCTRTACALQVALHAHQVSVGSEGRVLLYCPRPTDTARLQAGFSDTEVRSLPAPGCNPVHPGGSPVHPGCNPACPGAQPAASRCGGAAAATRQSCAHPGALRTSASRPVSPPCRRVASALRHGAPQRASQRASHCTPRCAPRCAPHCASLCAPHCARGPRSPHR